MAMRGAGTERAVGRRAARERAVAGGPDPERAARCLQALGHPARLLILQALRRGERTVGELEAEVGSRQSNVSQHLRIMLDRGILTHRREGNHVYYRVADPRVLDILAAVREVFCEK
jgi:DNA-binding transcriptional ArsR family regulator